MRVRPLPGWASLVVVTSLTVATGAVGAAEVGVGATASTGGPASVTAPEAPPTPGAAPHARWHPNYGAELEGHLLVAGLDRYQAGLGGGVNVAIPFAEHAPFRRIDDSLAVGIGLDWVRYAAYKPNEPNGRNVLTYAWYVPVSLQWNVWLGARASLFVEPALVYRFATYPDGCSGLRCADTARVLPTGSLGVRFRVAEHAALVVRVGWPMVTIGGSWL